MGCDLLCHKAGTHVGSICVSLVAKHPTGANHLRATVAEGLIQWHPKPHFLIEVLDLILDGGLDPFFGDVFLRGFVLVRVAPLDGDLYTLAILLVAFEMGTMSFPCEVLFRDPSFNSRRRVAEASGSNSGLDKEGVFTTKRFTIVRISSVTYPT